MQGKLSDSLKSFFDMHKTYRGLSELGVLGINRRIGDFILKHNPRKHFPVVDDKIKTAHRAESWGLSMPENYTVIESIGDLKQLGKKLQGLKSFVIKPARGSQGNGIIVIDEVYPAKNPEEVSFKRSNGTCLSLDEIKHHISGIVSGLYSLSGTSDSALIQERISLHPLFKNYAYEGIPDIRVIVFHGYPVMSMIRLPTHMSGGRANLHQGAIGVGLDLATGETTFAVHRSSVVEMHPDYKIPLKGLKLPHWDEILLLASRCYDLAQLGYLGVDIVLTQDKGPIILELNARPGLSIQVANLAGLTPRLKSVAQELQTTQRMAKEKVQWVKEHLS
jgi:alpha-L-glutamate ligase-like protein